LQFDVVNKKLRVLLLFVKENKKHQKSKIWGMACE